MSSNIDAKFRDGKDDSALRTIGEVSSALGIKTHVLRYWEQQFPALAPLKRSGRRHYRLEDIALLETIDRLVNREGYTLKGAQHALKGGKAGRADRPNANIVPGNEPPTNQVAADRAPRQNSEDLVDVIARLRAIRTKLAEALDQSATV